MTSYEKKKSLTVTVLEINEAKQSHADLRRPTGWPSRLRGTRDLQASLSLDVVRDCDNDTIFFAATGNMIKEDRATKEPRGRFRYGNRAFNIDETGWYFRRNIELDPGMDLTRQLLVHTLCRPNIFQRSSQNRLEPSIGFAKLIVPGIPNTEILQRPVRPIHGYFAVGDLSVHGTAVAGVTVALFTRHHQDGLEVCREARKPENFLLAGNGYTSLTPTPREFLFEVPLFVHATWPPYDAMTEEDMERQHQLEEDLLFEAIKRAAARYLPTRWCLSNSCHHFLGDLLNELIDLDEQHWIVPSNWRSALNPVVVDMVERSMRKGNFWRSMGKAVGHWRPMYQPWGNKDARGLIRKFDAQGKLIASEPYVDL